VHDRGVPEKPEPAPVDHCRWSAVQAAVTGGWRTTARFIAITTVPAVVAAVLGAGVRVLLAAVVQFYF